MIVGYMLTDIALFFLVYAVIGWITEVVYQAVSKGIVVNRGFLNGPICPIYGFGSLFVILLVKALGLDHSSFTADSQVFLLGMMLSTMLELIGGFALLKIFHARWWDYSSKPFNYHGYICLEFSIIWGFGILIVVRRIQPFVETVFGGLATSTVGIILLVIAYIAFISDFAVSVLIILGLNKRIKMLDDMKKSMTEFSDSLSNRIGDDVINAKEKVDAYRAESTSFEAEIRDAAADRRAEVAKELADMKRDYELAREEFYKKMRKTKFLGTGRILKSYPDLRIVDHSKIVDKIKENLKYKTKS
jgi:Predicted membrane protein|nr:putative ABC transporter permease [uncultured Mogibacterium sp.]